ncbi:MAG: peptide ABC transporter substrate-binding protein [Pirellulales bacterium]|nr:peptide ABC transporter substrate-binding protein [Pirellulales bacterium]
MPGPMTLSSPVGKLSAQRLAWLVAMGLLVLQAGCGGKPSDAPNTTEATELRDDAQQTPATPEQPTTLEPFDAPTLAELNDKVSWIDHTPVDSLEQYKTYLAQQPKLATVEEALKLRNTSEEANDKILSALGRPPESDADVNYNATINRWLRGDVKSTNPIMISSTAEFDVIGMTGAGLFGFDWNMTPFAVSSTVESWQTSDDYMYDKVVIRSDLTWSDGTPVTAHDVVFSFQTIMDPRVPIPAVRSGTDKIRWVEAYDDYTLVYFHKEPLATNIWNVNFPIVPKHIYEKTLDADPSLQNSDEHVRLENSPIVNGPYQIKSRVRGQEIVLERRDEWYMHEGKQVRHKPYFKTIRFRIIEDNNTALLAIKNGDIDDLELTPEQWKTQTENDDFYRRNTKATGLEWLYFYFGWNNSSPLFKDVRVRTAMSYAFDHTELLDNLLYGLNEPSNGIFHHTAWMAPQNPAPPFTQDLDKAEQLLDEAGWEDHDGDGVRDKEIGGKMVRFEFNLLVANVPERIKICNLLKENLDQIGVICNVTPLETTVLQERLLLHKFEANFGGWGTGADPDTAENVWATGEARNFVNYSNPEVDKLFEQGRREFDREKRAAIYAKIHELIYKDQPYTFLFFQSSFYGFNKNLRGYMFSPRGPYNYGPGFDAIWSTAQ